MGLKKYDITTDSGYKTTLLLSDEDAKARGLTGKNTTAAARARAAADAKAKEEAEAKAAADAEAQKQAPAPQNKQAKPAANK